MASILKPFIALYTAMELFGPDGNIRKFEAYHRRVFSGIVTIGLFMVIESRLNECTQPQTKFNISLNDAFWMHLVP